MKDAQVPAGLTDNNVELFVKDDKVFAIFSGRVILFHELPSEIREYFMNDLIENIQAIKLINEMGVMKSELVLEQFLKCRFGGLDNNPDLDVASGELTDEYWDCGKRGGCSAEGKLCQQIKVENGFLSRREIDVLKLITEGLTDKQIADRLYISKNTVASHKYNIQEKTGFTNKLDMAVFAVQKNIAYGNNSK